MSFSKQKQPFLSHSEIIDIVPYLSVPAAVGLEMSEQDMFG